jgi:hypothetical protein
MGVLTTYETAGGLVWRDGVNETFTNIRTGAGTGLWEGTGGGLYLGATSTSSQYSELHRGIFIFDTSLIGSTSTITSATLSLYGLTANYKGNGLGLSAAHAGLALVSASPASDTNLANSDYGTLGSTRFATDFAYADWTASTYNVITLNAAGLAAINKTGNTRIGMRWAVDLDAGTPAWSSSQYSFIYWNFLSMGTGIPKLIVNYTDPTVTTNYLRHHGGRRVGISTT